MKVRSSVKPICEKCKVIREKEASELSVRIQSTSRDRVNYESNNNPVICALWTFFSQHENRMIFKVIMCGCSAI